MASIKKTPSGAFQLCVRNKLLPKTYWATFDNLEDAERYGKHLEGMLAQGIVPAPMLEAGKRPSTSWSISRCTKEYIRANSIAVSDIKLLGTLQEHLTGVSTAHLSYEWVEAWIRRMKREENLSPSTIRHRHGALARCLDWVIRKHPEILAQNQAAMTLLGLLHYLWSEAQLNQWHPAWAGKRTDATIPARLIHVAESVRVGRALLADVLLVPARQPHWDEASENALRIDLARAARLRVVAIAPLASFTTEREASMTRWLVLASFFGMPPVFPTTVCGPLPSRNSRSRWVPGAADNACWRSPSWN